MEKKKVIIINNHFQYSDGTARVLTQLVNNLDKDKFDITIRPIYKCEESMKELLDSRVKLKKVFGFYFRGLNKLIRRLPVKLLYKLIVGEKYDIEIGFQCDLPTRIVGNSLNPEAVHVAWMHGYEFYPYEYSKCDRIVCVSKYCADKAKAEAKTDMDIRYIYNLVDDAAIKKAAEEKSELAPLPGVRFVSVGRMSPEKGYMRLVRILYQLRQEGYEFNLTLVGGGAQLSELEEEIKKLGMSDIVRLTGENKNPHKYTKNSDVFICSSFSEGYSTACTESAILGIPIISTDVPGGREIIDQCGCGILTGKDDESLKAGIRKVLAEPGLIGEWKKTMKQSSSSFSLESRKKAAEEFFDELYELSNIKEGDKRT